MQTAPAEGTVQAATLDAPEVGYLELLVTNPDYRRFWLSFLISSSGSWFNTVAVFVLVIELTGSELALGLIFALRMLAFSLPQPFTGMLADRYDRKTLMVTANVLSALVAVGLVFIDGRDQLWLLYVLVGLLMALHALEVPASQAALPNLVAENQLLTANALDTATWSATLALGCAAGGFVTAVHGVDAAFWIDAASFLVAAGLIATLRIPQSVSEDAGRPLLKSGLANILQGWRFILSRPDVLRLIFAKSVWTIGGGGLVFLLVLVGDELGFEDFAIGIGVMFLARGIGVGIGPLIAREVFKDREKWKYLIGLLITVSGVSYLIFGLVEWTLLSLGLVVFAHAASGSNWVLSNVMLQQRVPDEWRGRVFATDLLLMAGFHSISALLASAAVDREYLSLREALLVFAGIQVVFGLLFALWMRNGFERSPTAHLS